MNNATLSLRETAYERFRELMFEGRLRPGQFITQQELVEALQVPLGPTREAIKRLEAEGLLRVKPQKGLQIMEADPETIRDIFMLRAILEREGARRISAAPETFRPGLEALGKRYRELIELALAGEDSPAIQREAMQADWALHDFLIGSLGNQVARDVYRANADKIRMIQGARGYTMRRLPSAMNEHLEIIEALLAGKGDAAAAAIDQHVVNSLQRWVLYPPGGAL